jgi:MoxR-like ATPase
MSAELAAFIGDPARKNPHVDRTALLVRLQDNIARVLLGKPGVIKLSVVTLLAEGHLLIEDVPGVGKTLLGKALARSLNCTFHRIQFTPDLLPSDLIGTSVYHQPSGEFNFKPGPLFSHVVLADEINRATPRTQSALLEAMSERQVSIDGQTHTLAAPFMVLATQNPYEFEGTFTLPENQLDRFALRLRIGYPERNVEKEVLKQHRVGEPVDHLKAVLTQSELLSMQTAVRLVRVEDSLNDYLMDIVDATRSRDDVYLGVSTRGALIYYRACQALAYLESRDYVTPDDIKRLAVPVLSHRILSRSYQQNGRIDTGEAIIKEIIDETPVPI